MRKIYSVTNICLGCCRASPIIPQTPHPLRSPWFSQAEHKAHDRAANVPNGRRLYFVVVSSGATVNGNDLLIFNRSTAMLGWRNGLASGLWLRCMFYNKVTGFGLIKWRWPWGRWQNKGQMSWDKEGRGPWIMNQENILEYYLKLIWYYLEF